MTQVRNVPKQTKTDVGDDFSQIETSHNPYANSAAQRWHYTSSSTSNTITNTKTDSTIIQIAKEDQFGNAVVGAKMQLIDAGKNIVQEWTTEETPDKWNGILPGTYTLHEVSAPDGYQLADDMEIVINDTKELQTYTMVDPKAGHLKVTKEIIGRGRENDSLPFFCQALGKEEYTDRRLQYRIRNEGANIHNFAY